MKIKGLALALESARARSAFITHTKGTIFISPSDLADDSEAQVPYTVKRDDAQPEMASALMRQQSARISIFTKGAPFKITAYLINRAVEDQSKGVMITHKARDNYELDDHGRPIRAIGNKSVRHLRVSKTGAPVTLPTVFIIHTHPLRYKIEPHKLSDSLRV